MGLAGDAGALRVKTLQMEPGRRRLGADRLRSEDIPAIQELDAFKGMTELTDRQSGKTIAVSFWESEEAM